MRLLATPCLRPTTSRNRCRCHCRNDDMMMMMMLDRRVEEEDRNLFVNERLPWLHQCFDKWEDVPTPCPHRDCCCCCCLWSCCCCCHFGECIHQNQPFPMRMKDSIRMSLTTNEPDVFAIGLLKHHGLPPSSSLYPPFFFYFGLSMTNTDGFYE